MVVTLPLPPVYSPYIHENVYENVVCEMATILSMGGGGGGGGGGDGSINEYDARIF